MDLEKLYEPIADIYDLKSRDVGDIDFYLGFARE